jgi:hypothetical protein
VIRSLALSIIFFSLSLPTFAQRVRSPERAALANMRKQHWGKAGGLLYKTLRKDSVNALANYIFSVFFFKPQNPLHQPDSAYHYILHSLKDFPHASRKDRDKWKRKFAVDSLVLVRQRAKIDSAVFEATKLINTEAAYIKFLATHPLAAQREEALALRDEVAYLHTVKQNTHEAFLEFLQRYPSAVQVPEARKKYDRLLYEAKTKDKKLASFEFFLRTYPETPFRKEIEQHIFELFTLSGEIERFLSFLQLYPQSSQVKKARDILFHLLQDQDDLTWPGLFLTDSLQNILQLQENYLVPIFKNGMFGFMDKHGAEVIPPELQQIKEDFKCGNITADVLVFPDRILARNGLPVYKGTVEDVVDLGAGFLKIVNDTCHRIIHKSGLSVEDCVQDAKILGNRFLTIRKQQHWYIHALNGRLLMPEAWDEILLHEDVLLLKKERQWYLLTPAQLVEVAEQQRFSISNSFDDINLFSHGLMGVKAHDYQGILTQDLQDFIPFDKQKITPSFFGFTRYISSGYSLYNWSGRQASYFDKIITHEPWVAVKKNHGWYLFDTQLLGYKSAAYDSIRFEGPFPIGIHGDTLAVCFGDKRWLEFAATTTARYMPGKDSSSFLILEAEGKKSVYDLKGRKLFTTDANQLQYAGLGLFIISKKEKKGLVDITGNMLLPVEYDAIGSVTNNVVSLLKGTKFGLFQVKNHQLIKSEFAKNLIPYCDQLVVAFRDGFFGFIDWNNKEHTRFEYEEIRYWNDTLAWVKKNQLWMLYDILAKNVVESNIRQIKMIRDTPDEKLAILQRDDLYGVASNKHGLIMPLSFTDLVNLGSAEEPLYLTEKHIEEASLYVVIYYDKNAQLLRREVYEDSDDYEKFYCHNN